MELPTSTPRAQGVDADGLCALVAGMQSQSLDLHGIVVARHGHVIASGWADPYGPDRVQLVYSLSKSLTAMAVALLVQRGQLGLDDAVLDHLDVSGLDVDPRWREVRVRHCLSMTVGHVEDAWPSVVDRDHLDGVRADRDWLPAVLAVVPTAEPGTVFAYNQVATYLLSRVVHRLAGGIRAVLRPDVLDPLGIGVVPWHTDPQGRELGFSGAHLTTGSVLKLAQLFLDRGAWQGRRLVEDRWFDEAAVAFGPPNTDPDASPDWCRGYGYSFWMQQVGYRGDGAFGQFAIVLPDHDVAVAITSEHERMQSTLDLLVEHLVPAIDRPGSAAADDRLAAVLADLAFPPAGGTVRGPDLATFDAGVTGTFPAAWGGATTRTGGSSVELVLHRGDEAHVVAVGDGTWFESVLHADGWALPVVAAGGWEGDTFRAEVRVVETPHTFHVTGSATTGRLDLSWRLVPLTGRDPFGLAVRRTA